MLRRTLFAACGLCLAATATAAVPTRDGCSEVQLKIRAKHDPGMGVHGGWTLVLETSGKGRVETDAGTTYALQLSGAECAKLAAEISEAQFFTLKDSYGVPAVDSPVRELEISLGAKRHSLGLFPGLEVGANRAAVSRALRVWIAVRSLFNAPDAVDSRDEDRAFLRGAKTAAQRKQ